MKTQGVVVADDPVFVNWLQKGVGSAAEFSLLRASSADELVDRLASIGRFDVVFFEFTAENQLARGKLIEGFLERYPDVPVVGIGADAAQDLVLSAMRSGARDFFVLQRDDTHLPDLLSKVLRRSVGGGTSRSGNLPQQGRVVTLFSATAYEGVAFCAEHLALELLKSRSESERGLLLDLSAPPGASAVFLNLNPSYSLLDAVNDVYRCDQTLVDTAFSRHGSGLYVLSLPEETLGFPDIDGDELVRLIEVLRTLFGFVVIAADGHAGTDLLTGVIGISDHSLLVTDQSILRSRHNKHLLRELRLSDVALNHARLVVDCYQRRLGLDADNLSQLLELPLAATLSCQPGNRIQAMNSGEPLSTVAPRDPYIREIGALAEQLLGRGAGGAKDDSGGMLSRIFGRS